MFDKIITIFAADESGKPYLACDELSGAAREAAGCDTTGTVFDPVNNIINTAIGVVAVVAVIMIVVGGVHFATSAGDAQKAKKARETIIYGVVGLIVAILAFAIVNFVIGSIS